MTDAASRLSALYAATTALTDEEIDEERLLTSIVEQAARLTSARYAALGLVGADGRLERFVTHGLSEAEYEALHENPPVGRGILGALLIEGRPLRLDDLTLDPRSTGFPPGHPPMRSFLGVPLQLRGAVIGRLYMTESRDGVFDDEDEQFALGYAAAASVAIGNARLNARVQAERRAAQMAAGQLRAALDSVEHGVYMTHGEGLVILANERLHDVLGITSSPVGEPEAGLARHFTSPDGFLSTLAIERTQPRLQFTEELELAIEPRRVVRRYGAPVVDTTGRLLGRVAVYADVTQEREVQQHMMLAERLRATGEMASGVAHDFNNLLATILGRVEVILGQTQDAALRENLQAVQRAARDGAATVARMREYGRPLDAGEFVPISLEAVAREAVELTQPRWRDQAQREGRTIAVEMRLRPTRPVMGEAASLRDVLVNLIFNAVDAMPGGGSLTIDLAPGDLGAELVVRDTGQGMPEAVLRRAFEPFFTTKGDRGSGLGLAMVRKVLAAHGGRVDVQSAPGDGTTFRLWLPAAEGVVPGDEHEPLPAQGGRVGRIAVIDDQRDVLDTTAMILRADGHDVRVWEDPVAAVEAILTDPPNLVLSDLGMPGMNGWDVARSLHARHPGLPVLLLTGWGREISAAQAREGGIAGVLAKPVDADALRRAVEAALPIADTPIAVLLVDDSAAFAAVLAILIGQSGHAVTRAESGQAALEALDGGPYDLVLLDVGLPDRPATEIIAAARHARGAPLICVASGGSLSQMQTLAPGADQYIEKVRVPELLDGVFRMTRARPR